MRRVTYGGVLLTLLLFGTPACVLEPEVSVTTDAEPTSAAAPAGPIEEESQIEVGYDSSERNVGEEAAQEGPDVGGALPVLGRRSRYEPLLFHLGAGYGTLGRIDLDECRASGLAPGRLRVQAIFHGSGHVVRAFVQSPSPPPHEALACIGERLQAALVPRFDGPEVTLSKTFFVSRAPQAPSGEDGHLPERNL